MSKDKITVIKVDLGFDVEDEINKSITEQVHPDTIKDAKEILDKLAEKPAVKKIENNNKLEEICQIIFSTGKIAKDKLTELTGKNTISAVGSLRNYAQKTHNKVLVKKKDDYLLEDCPAPASPASEPTSEAPASQPE